MFFIEHLIKKIKYEQSVEYKRAYMQAESHSDDQLLLFLEDKKALVYTKEKDILTRLYTTGCSHYFCQGELCGCSMCNLHIDDYNTIAKMQVLRKRSPSMYSDIAFQMAQKARKDIKERAGIEYLFAYDCFDAVEVPLQLWERLLKKKSLFYRTPLVIQMEGRADSVSYEKLKFIIGQISPSQLSVRLGVECGDEWIRNHWLNKKVSNQQIIEAVDVCKKLNVKVSANILFGIPGFTEEQSINHFVKSVIWLDSLNVDYITCSVLVNKPGTLQGLIYEVYSEHAGFPWLFSLLEALRICSESIDQFYNKIIFGEYDGAYFHGKNAFAYNASIECPCRLNIVNDLILQKDGLQKHLCAALDKMIKDPCYIHYRLCLEKEREQGDELQVLKRLVNTLSRYLWKEDAEVYINMFLEEQKLLYQH